MTQSFPLHLGTHDPRKDIVDTCLKDDSGNSDITFEDINGSPITVSIEYEDYGEDLKDVNLPALLIREIRGVEIPTSVGWNTYMRTLEFDVSFYMAASDDVNVKNGKREVQDDLVWHIQNNQEDVTNTDNVKVTTVRPVTDFDRKRNIYGFVATVEAIQKD